MLYEILSDKFISKNEFRGPIKFNKGLNIVQGHDSGTNSIGKSTFLLAIDFAFGGSTYAEDKILIDNIGHHMLNFTFKFNDQFFYFSRHTATPNTVNICNDSYMIHEQITLKEFCKKLFNLYKINLPSITLRQIVGRYFRVYGRDSSDEKHPLASHSKEAQKDSLLNFLKLFNGYKDIETLYATIKEKEEYKKAISDADKFKFVHIIKNQTEYKNNQKNIQLMDQELDLLSKYGREELLNLNPEEAELAAKCKEEYDTLSRKKRQLWTKYYSIKDTAEKTRPTNMQDFQALLKFFPNSNLALLQDIEQFHTKLTKILNEEFSEALKEILNSINEKSKQLSILEIKLQAFDLPKRISENTLQAYADISSRKKDLEQQNFLYEKQKSIKEEIKKLKENYESVFLNSFHHITNKLNHLIAEKNNYIYGENFIAPTLNVLSSKHYEYGTVVDNGTGTNYKNLILLDLVSLDETPLPVIAHDTILFKQIAQEPMAKIIELYTHCDKQIFIAIDETVKYDETAQNIINAHTILNLSAHGNELFGSSFAKRKDNTKLE